MIDRGHLFAAGISYRTAPLALRENFAVAPADRVGACTRVKSAGGLAEIVLLWTCNRVEIYGVSPRADVDAARLLGELSLQRRAPAAKSIYLHAGEAALRHLFSVAAGLDSLVLGETEITGQVRDTYEVARTAGLTGRQLNRAFQKALATAKEIRTTTAIGRGATSVGSVVLQRAREYFGDSLKHRRVLILGAGKMAETCLLYLCKNDMKDLVVVNRSRERAEELAAAHGGRAVPLAAFEQELQAADLAICSTGCPVTVLNRPAVERVMAARKGRPLVLVDIAVPRDVAPDVGAIPGVHLCDMDGLEATVRRNVAHREEDLALCQDLVSRRARETMQALEPGPCIRADAGMAGALAGRESR